MRQYRCLRSIGWREREISEPKMVAIEPDLVEIGFVHGVLRASDVDSFRKITYRVQFILIVRLIFMVREG